MKENADYMTHYQCPHCASVIEDPPTYWAFRYLFVLIKHQWELTFPEEPFTDPQDALQRMSARIIALQREKAKPAGGEEVPT